MDVMENNPEYTGYVFDAQSSIIDEYLKIRPEEKERLAKLIGEKTNLYWTMVHTG